MTPSSQPFDESCAFCKLVRNDDGSRVFEDEQTIAFLDHRPLFPGHCLLIPKNHLETIQDLPQSLVAPFFTNVKILAAAVELGMQAEGTFIAANNRISQSVPHFHVHVVPRRKGDGLKGFFWPRRKYGSTEELTAALKAIRAAILRVRQIQGN